MYNIDNHKSSGGISNRSMMVISYLQTMAIRPSKHQNYLEKVLKTTCRHCCRLQQACRHPSGGATRTGRDGGRLGPFGPFGDHQRGSLRHLLKLRSFLRSITYRLTRRRGSSTPRTGGLVEEVRQSRHSGPGRGSASGSAAAVLSDVARTGFHTQSSACGSHVVMSGSTTQRPWIRTTWK